MFRGNFREIAFFTVPSRFVPKPTLCEAGEPRARSFQIRRFGERHMDGFVYFGHAACALGEGDEIANVGDNFFACNRRLLIIGRRTTEPMRRTPYPAGLACIRR